MNNQSSHTILAVNDSLDQLELLKFTLEQAGYNVLTAVGGSAGLDIIRRTTPDLVISDVTVTDSSGIELCRRLRTIEKFQTLPILLVSALHKDATTVGEALKAGADDYLEEPFDPIHLAAVVARLVGGRRTKDTLRESESYFRSLIENISDIITILSKDGIIFYESPSVKQILGYEPEDLIGKNAFDFVHPADCKSVIAYFTSAIRGSENLRSIEYRFKHRDGSWRELESVGKIIEDPHRDMVAVVNSRDVTERHQSQKALRESEERFKAQYKGIPLPTYTWRKIDGDFILIDYNDAAEEVTGGKMRDWLGSKAREMYKDMPEIPANFQRCLEEQKIIQQETIYRYRATNVTRHLDISYVCIPPDTIMVHTRDITEKREAEAKLRYQKTLLEAQSEASIDGILIVSTDGEIISHNQRFIEMWELSDNVLNTKSNDSALKAILDKLVNPKEFLETVNYLYKNTDEINHTEIELKNGRVFERYSAPVKDGDNTYYGRVWFFHDITHRRSAEEKLRESEFRYRKLVELSPDAIIVHTEGKIDFLNRAAVKMLGAETEEQLINRAMLDFVHPDYRELVLARVEKLKRGEPAPLIREKLVRLDGKVIDVDIIGIPLIYKGIPGVQAIVRDITERTKAEAAVIEANERAIREYNNLLQRLSNLAQTVGTARDLDAIFAAILSFVRASAPCSALIISLIEPKQKARKIIYCWYNGGEMDAASLPTVPVDKGIVGQAIKSGETLINNDYLNALQESGKIVSIGFDQDERNPQSIIIVPMKIKGNSIGVIEIQSYDLGAYKQEHATAMSMAGNIIANAIENVRLHELERQREEELRQSQKLESVGRLAGGIAHDFNNMLTAINGYSSLTLRRMSSDDPLRQNIEEIKKAGERSAELTRQLLAFSRKQVLKPKVVDINHAINDITFMLKRLIGEDVQLVPLLHPQIGQVMVDPGQLSQVIMNLAVNARDAMPNGGTLTIETNNVHLDEEYAAEYGLTEAGNYVMLTVSDTGTGIDSKTMEHIFEPFFTTKEVGKGTGLGLATVYGIVKQSGGYIWAYSEPQQGTTFKIYLPRVDEQYDIEERHSLSGEMAIGSETILLVEDELLVRSLSRQILEDCGYKVVEAGNGVEALKICAQDDCRIDLLMTDVVMPQMGGRELAEKLAVTQPQLKVLFTSGYTDDSIVRHGMIDSGINFIQKPFTPTALALKIRQALDDKTRI